MKKLQRLGLIFLIILLIPLSINQFNKDLSEDSNKLIVKRDIKVSTYWNLTGIPILIDDTDPSRNWSKTANDNLWCSGSGTWNDPYVIENVTIDGQGVGSAIEIRNSNASYFIINNNTLFNASTGLKLYNSSRGFMTNNSLTANLNKGLFLDLSNNNSISWNNISNNGDFSASYGYGIDFTDSHLNSLNNNTINQNSGLLSGHGIWLTTSNNNTLNGNIFESNQEFAILVQSCTNLSLSWNSMIRNGIIIGPFDALSSIDTTNTVNNKPLYYYINQENLVPNDFINAGQIILYNVNNSLITGVNTSFGSIGIFLESSSNNIIRNSVSNNNTNRGYWSLTGANNTIKHNSFNNNGRYGISQSGSFETFFNNSIVNSGQDGFSIDGDNNNISSNIIQQSGINGISLSSQFNFIEGNNISLNNVGMLLEDTNNSVNGNFISQNINYGIYFASLANNNTLFQNSLINNFYAGVGLDFNSNDNLFYNNSFISNIYNAYDNGTSNIWDNGMIGNYWDDYESRGGYDLDDDGIGDIWYNVNGTIENDTLPIWNDGEDIPPVVTIVDPLNNAILGAQAPDFTVSITEPNLNTTWYSIFNQSQWSANFTFVGTTETINQTAWDWAGLTIITLRVYANDSKGYMDFDNINMTKDFTSPIVTINNPNPNDEIGSISPSYDLTIIEANLDTTWYEIWNGFQWSVPYTFIGTTGSINQTLWTSLPDGSLNITFYANDTANNIGNASVVVIKDSLSPSVIINSPISLEVFSISAPTFNLEVSDSTLNTTWYQLTNGTLWSQNFIITNNGTINQTAWDIYTNPIILIYFYANDSMGNLNTTLVSVIKDIAAPIINIVNPTHLQEIGSTAPTFIVSYSDNSVLNSSWYSIYDGTQWTLNTTFSGSGEIDQTLWTSIWDTLDHGDVITIRFYGNDSFGYMSFSDVQVKKYDPPAVDGFDLIEFLTSPLGLTIVGVTIGGVIALVLVLRRRGGYKTSSKEADRIRDLTT